jgi:alkanesulfonate monooxygenase SsuD/methylene tetrahydromethanopterin reductase-like flavin-dependent oxidoreductase (luciferase family)
VGGNGPRVRVVAGQAADAWSGWGLTPDELAVGLAHVRLAADRAGRDPASVAATWGGQVLVGEDAGHARGMLGSWQVGRPLRETGRVVAGDGPTVAARLAELGEAGAAWCVVSLVGGVGAELRPRLARGAGIDTQSL